MEENIVVNGDVVKLPIPSDTSLKIVGITNSGGWKQMIAVQLNTGAPINWTGTGVQSGTVVGTYNSGPDPNASELKVTMQHDRGDGQGPQPSTVSVWAYAQPGLSGYIIGGQDSGGRPSGPAYWNTMVLVYWAPGY